MHSSQERKDVRYRFKTEAAEHVFDVTVTRKHVPQSLPEDAPEWTSLSFYKCEGCQWTEHGHCPVALRLHAPARALGTMVSYQPAEITVETTERTYTKKTDVQDGLGSLLGLLMATSGCPSLEALRPAAWFHLPFATFEETLYRIASMWLLGGYFKGEPHADMEQMIDQITPLYARIGQVNRGLCDRLRAAAVARTDAPRNAITILDTYAMMVPMSIEDGFEELRSLFAEQD